MPQIEARVFLEFDPASMPPSPSLPSMLRQQLGSNGLAMESTNSLTMTPCQVMKTIQVTGPCRVRVEIDAHLGHNTSGALVLLGLQRNGVPLKSGQTLASATLSGEYDIRHTRIDYVDEITDVGPAELTYQMIWRQTSSSGTPYAYHGRRGINSESMGLTTIRLSELDPLP